MENTWAEPEGYPQAPPRVRYRIRAPKAGSDGLIPSDRFENRVTSIAYDGVVKAHFHSLAPFDQHFADKITDLVQKACSYFYADEWEPLEGSDEVRISDEEVRTRIDRLNRGENFREAARLSRSSASPKKLHYPLDELPWDQQRALIERIEALKAEWGFEIIGEEEAAE